MFRLRVWISGVVFGAVFLIWLIPFVFNQQIFGGKTVRFWFATVPLFLTVIGLIVFWQSLATSRRRNFRVERASIPLNESSFAEETINSVVSQLESERRQQRLRAETAEEFNQRVVANLLSGLIVFDSLGRVRLANKAARQIFANENEILNDLSAETVFQNVPKLAQLIAKTIETGKIFRRETFEMYGFDNRKRVIGASITSLSDASGSHHRSAMCLLTDITEVSELREQLALRQNLAALGEMAAGLTHEFKNSLATIQTLAQFLQNANPDEKQMQAARGIVAEIESLSQIVTSFLDFARPQKLNYQNFSLAELIAECLDEIAAPLLQASIHVKTNGIFPDLEGDPALLKRAFANILRNACEACAEASGERRILITGKIKFESSGKKMFEVGIEDSGKGIDEKDLAFVFVPFFTTKSEGHGIGLALAHRIVTEHGGKLSASNSSNGGAVFYCRLPLK
jgi:signal transduction histidine kinase